MNICKGEPVIRASFLILASLMVASAASAADQYTATLAAPVKDKVDIIAESNLFRCEGTTCTLVSKPLDAASVSTCRRLARQVGEVKAYGTPSAQFDADKLSRCNAK